jgi:uncharacterized membrane protein
MSPVSMKTLRSLGRARPRLLLLEAVLVVCGIVIATAFTPGVPVVTVVAGIIVTFAGSGTALLLAAAPQLSLSLFERALASLGLSLAVAVCTGVVLGVTPIGLSRASGSVALAGITVALSLTAIARMRLRPGEEQWTRESKRDERP